MINTNARDSNLSFDFQKADFPTEIDYSMDQIEYWIDDTSKSLKELSTQLQLVKYHLSQIRNLY